MIELWYWVKEILFYVLLYGFIFGLVYFFIYLPIFSEDEIEKDQRELGEARRKQSDKDNDEGGYL